MLTETLSKIITFTPEAAKATNTLIADLAGDWSTASGAQLNDVLMK